MFSSTGKAYVSLVRSCIVQTSIVVCVLAVSYLTFCSSAETGACLAKMDIAAVFVGNSTFQFKYISGEDNDTTWPRKSFAVILGASIVFHNYILSCLI